jgi:hypothetical protein
MIEKDPRATLDVADLRAQSFRGRTPVTAFVAALRYRRA